MSAPQLAAHLESASPLLLDVREPWEFDTCHIDGSINVPMGQVPQRIDELQDADEIIVICHHGVRSQQVIWYLQQHEFDDLVNLDGGVDAWARSVDTSMPVLITRQFLYNPRLVREYTTMPKPVSKLALIVTGTLLTLGWWQNSAAEDLMDVYQLALQNDAELMIAESNYLAAVQALPLAQSSRKPQIFFNANGRVRESDNSETGDNSSDNIGYSVDLTQSLYNTEVQGNIRVAEANTAAELARLQSARQSLIVRVANTYFSILAAEDNVEFAYAERTAIARQLEEAQKRFEVGLIAITDVVEAQASFDSAEASVILAENVLENAKQALVVLTADSSIDQLAPLGGDLKLSLPNPITVQAWVLLALNNNLDLIAAQQSMNAARYERDKNTRNRNPTVDLIARLLVVEDDGRVIREAGLGGDGDAAGA